MFLQCNNGQSTVKYKRHYELSCSSLTDVSYARFVSAWGEWVMGWLWVVTPGGKHHYVKNAVCWMTASEVTSTLKLHEQRGNVAIKIWSGVSWMLKLIHRLDCVLSFSHSFVFSRMWVEDFSEWAMMVPLVGGNTLVEQEWIVCWLSSTSWHSY